MEQRRATCPMAGCMGGCGKPSHLERAGHKERIDHRSHAGRDLMERLAVHEGVVTKTMEKKALFLAGAN